MQTESANKMMESPRNKAQKKKQPKTRIREILKRKHGGLSTKILEDFAKSVGMTVASVYAWDTHRPWFQNPHMTTKELVSLVLGEPIDYIFPPEFF